MIVRSSPDVDYLGADVFEALAFAQTVRAGDTVYLSGVAPVKGSLPNIELVGDNQRDQLKFCCRVIDDLLKVERLGRDSLVSLTLYTTNLQEMMGIVPELIGPWVGEHRPTSMMVEVTSFPTPGQLCEIVAIAYAG